MSETQFETDEFLKLLTEALRAGPGSPPWHDALARLRAGDLTQAEEYKLLMSAREDLESGRDYRSIRPGPVFTRKVMGRIDDEAAGRGRGLPTATLIALLAGLVIVASIVVVAVILIRGHTPTRGIADLDSTYFANPVLSSDFAQKSTADWEKWASVGDEPTFSDKGLRPAFHRTASKDYQTSGLRAVTPVPAAQSFAIEARVQMARPTSQVYLRLFISDDLRAATPHEFVVELKNGDLTSYNPEIKNVGSVVKAAPGAIKLTVKVDQENVIVQSGEKQLYAGPHGLSRTAARYPGLRFGIQGGKENGLEDVVVQSMRVLEP